MPFTSDPPNGDLSNSEFALWHLRIAIDDKNDPPLREDEELIGLMNLDRAFLKKGTPPAPVVYYRPWETAAQLIELNEYEVVGELTPVTNRKITALRRRQAIEDTRHGFVGLTDANGDLLVDAQGYPLGTGTPGNNISVRLTWGD